MSMPSQDGLVFDYETEGTTNVCFIHHEKLEWDYVPVMFGRSVYGCGVLKTAPFGRIAAQSAAGEFRFKMGLQPLTTIEVKTCNHCVNETEAFTKVSRHRMNSYAKSLYRNSLSDSNQQDLARKLAQ